MTVAAAVNGFWEQIERMATVNPFQVPKFRTDCADHIRSIRSPNPLTAICEIMIF